jgi:hypothetical protein
MGTAGLGRRPYLYAVSSAIGALIYLSNMVPLRAEEIGKSKTHEVRGAETPARVADQFWQNIATMAATKAPNLIAGLDGINPNFYSSHGVLPSAVAMLYTDPNSFFWSIRMFMLGETSRPLVTSLLLVACGTILISILLLLAGFKKRCKTSNSGFKKQRGVSANFLARCDPALFAPADPGVCLAPSLDSEPLPA